MKLPVIIREAAIADLAAAVAYYQRFGHAERFRAEIDAVVQRVSTLPQAAPIVGSDVRRALVRRYPYAVFYVVGPRELAQVLRVSDVLERLELREARVALIYVTEDARCVDREFDDRPAHCHRVRSKSVVREQSHGTMSLAGTFDEPREHLVQARGPAHRASRTAIADASTSSVTATSRRGASGSRTGIPAPRPTRRRGA